MIPSVIVAKRNAALIAQAATLWIGPDDLVMDVTWGRGRWWTTFEPKFFIAHDKHTLDGVDFRYLPEADDSIDVVAFDPPYTSTGSKDTSSLPDHYERYGLAPSGGSEGWEATFALITAGMAEATRVLKPGGRLLVKCCDYVEGGHRRWGHRHVVDTAAVLGLVQTDEFIHYSGTGAQPRRNLDGSARRQVHSRRAHSFLIVFTKPKKRRSQCPRSSPS